MMPPKEWTEEEVVEAARAGGWIEDKETGCPQPGAIYFKEVTCPQPEAIYFVDDEVRTVSATGGVKGVKPERYDLLPVGPLRAVARHYGVGAAKYDDHNWRKGYEWSKSYAALQRHLAAFWGGEDIDAETGSPHLAAVVFHCLALMEFADTHPEYDDRVKNAAT